jgi:uncharacterized protein DUF4157
MPSRHPVRSDAALEEILSAPRRVDGILGRGYMGGYRQSGVTHDIGTSGSTRVGASGTPGKHTLVETIYRSVTQGVSTEASSQVTEALDKAGGETGEPLASGTRSKLESSIDADLSNVRVHTGANSGAAASAIGASAYAAGSDIHFAAGKYNAAGDHLLAHEIAHTVQQQGSGPSVQTKLAISSPTDAHEVAADRFADAFVAGQAHAVAPSNGIQGVVSRQPAPASGTDAGGAANMCTADDANRQAEAALQTLQLQINQCVAVPPPAPAPPGPVCAVTLSSRPLNQALTEVMQAEGMTAAQIATVWSAVQRRVASSYGSFYDTIGTLQRTIYTFLQSAEGFEHAGGTVAQADAAMRVTATAFLAGELPRIHEQIKQQVANAAVDAIQHELHRTVPCLHEQVKAAVDGALPQSAFGTIDFTTGTSREIRFRVTSQFAVYRTAVQAAMQTMASTTVQPIVTGNASGIHMEMLTAGDHASRVTTAGSAIDAGHLHMSGGNAADVQSMAWDVYQMQATSNNANQLVTSMVAGAGQHFDVVLKAVNASPTTSYDAFINNEVDLADIHGEHTIPTAGSTSHPQAQESVYAHFLHERQYDATHSAADMTAVQAQAQTLETQRVQLTNDFAALPVRIQTVLHGGTVTPPLTPAETTHASAWATRATTWQATQAANAAAFNSRFNPAHSHAIDQENAYNRERGFDDARPH